MKKQFFAMALLCLSATFVGCSADEEMDQEIEIQQNEILQTTNDQNQVKTTSSEEVKPIDENPELWNPGTGIPSFGAPEIAPPVITNPGITGPGIGDDNDNDKDDGKVKPIIIGKK